MALLALIDGDMIPYIVGYSPDLKDNTNKQDYYDRVDSYIQAILDGLKTYNYIGYLSGGNNFRYKIYPEYKAGRKADKPPFFHEIMRYLIDKYRFHEIIGAECDDALALTQSSYIVSDGVTRSVICSTDKDLKQVSGYHYNIKTFTREAVSKDEANRNLWKQVAMGDNTDNIPGITGIGKVKADKMMDQVSSDNRGRAVYVAYVARYGSTEGERLFKLNFRLVYLLRYNNHFKIPQPSNIRELV